MNSIRIKVFMAILLTTLAMVVAVALISYRKSANMIETDYIASLRQNTAQAVTSIDRMFLEAYNTHIHAACSTALREAILDYRADGGEQRLETCAEILRTFSRQNIAISSLYLLLPEDGVLVTSEDYPVYKKDVPGGEMNPAILLAENAGGPGILPDAAHHAAAMVSFSDAVEDEAGVPLGYLLSNIKERTLYYGYIAQLRRGAVKEAVLLDRDGQILTSLGLEDGSIPADWLPREDHTWTEGEFLFCCQKAPFSQCRLLLMADRDVVLTALRRTQQNYMVLLIIFLILSLLPASYLTDLIYRPLGKLTAAIRKVSEGDLETRIEITSGDEIEVLAGEFNQMLAKIETLIQQLLDEEQKKEDAELEALQYQITPHFMYNTLNAIKCAAMLQGERELGRALDDFIELLQACASKKGTFLTVAEEFHILECYIRLQEFRYDGRFSIQYDVAPEARNCLVPRLVLQPLVENALFHGLDMKRQDGRLTIRASVADGTLCLCVQDNGRGMTREQIDRLLHSEARKTRGLTAVGVPNVRDRLRIYYGSEAGLRYESSPAGTAAMIYLPVSKGGAEADEKGSDC